MPMKSISAGASQATGLTVMNNALWYKGERMTTVSLHQALVSFLDFLKMQGEQIVLIGHNIASYDLPVLIHSLAQVKMVGAFKEVVCGCLDTLPISRAKVPKQTVSAYKQEVLVKELMGEAFEAHNALGDVRALQRLYSGHLELSTQQQKTFLFDFLQAQHRQTLEPLVKAGVVSKGMQVKLAKCGLGLPALKLVHQRDPEAGLRNILHQHVTKTRTVVEKLFKHLAK